MAVNPISISGPLFPPSMSPTPASGSPGRAAFANIVDRFLEGAAGSHQAAEASVQELVMGRTDNIQGVLMNVAQADLNFRLILEIRNRLIESYQEIMKMQV